MGAALLAFVLVPSWANSADPAPLTGAALKKECVKVSTAMLEVVQSVMYGHGYADGQDIYILLKFEALPDDCIGKFKRTVSGVVYMKDGADHRRRIKLADQFVYGQNDKGFGILDKGPGGHYGWPAKQLLECTPGPGKTPVFAYIKRSVAGLPSGHVLKGRTSKIPVRVTAPC